MKTILKETTNLWRKLLSYRTGGIMLDLENSKKCGRNTDIYRQEHNLPLRVYEENDEVAKIIKLAERYYYAARDGVNIDEIFNEEEIKGKKIMGRRKMEDMGSVGLEVATGLTEALTEEKKSRDRPILNKKTLDRINELVQDLESVDKDTPYIYLNRELFNSTVGDMYKRRLIAELELHGYRYEEEENE